MGGGVFEVTSGQLLPVFPNPEDPSMPMPLNSSTINNILEESFKHYATFMIEADGRPICDVDGQDLDADNNKAERVSFSEGVSYVLRRAVILNKKTIFAKTWEWAQKNLQRKNIFKVYHWNKKTWLAVPTDKQDNLFAWRWHPNMKGQKGGVIYHEKMTDDDKGVWHGGLEAASDADLDIAAALILAGQRWNNNQYLLEAQAILNDIWTTYVKEVEGRYFLVATDRQPSSDLSLGELNASYLRPAYFNRLFPLIDTKHPWKKLARDSYRLMANNGDINLRSSHGSLVEGKANLPSNWTNLTTWGQQTNNYNRQANGAQLFGWDAVRTLYAASQGRVWNNSPQSIKYLTDNSCSVLDAGPYCFLKEKLNSTGTLLAGYNHDGTKVSSTIYEARNLDKSQPFSHGIYLPYFYYAGDLKAAQRIYTQLMAMYNRRGFWGKDEHEYYQNNWAWFGLAMINQQEIPHFDHLAPKPSFKPGIAATRPEWQTPKRVANDAPKLDSRKLQKLFLQKKLSFEAVQKIIRAISFHAKKTAGADFNLNILPEEDKFFSTAFPERKVIAKIDRQYGYKFMSYLGNAQESWNNTVTLFSVYAQQVIEKDDPSLLTKTYQMARNLRKVLVAKTEQINQEKAAGTYLPGALPTSNYRKMLPSEYGLAVLRLTEAELLSQHKLEKLSATKAKEVYLQGIDSTIKAIASFLAIEGKQDYPSKPDYYTIANALLVIGRLAEKAAEVSLSSSEKAGYLNYANNIYKQFAKLKPADDPANFVQNGYSLNPAKGMKVEVVSPQNPTKTLFSLDLPAKQIKAALDFNHQQGHMTAAERDEAEMAIFYTLPAKAAIGRAGIYLAQVKVKTPQEVAAQLLEVKKAEEKLETMKKYLIETKFLELFGTLSTKEATLKFSPEELTTKLAEFQDYVNTLEKRRAFSNNHLKLTEGALLTLLADRIVHYNSKQLDPAVKQKQAAALKSAQKFVAKHLDEFKNKAYYHVLDNFVAVGNKASAAKALANQILATVKAQYSSGVPARFKYLHLWSKLNQLEYEIRMATYIPNTKLPGEIDFGQLAVLIQDCNSLQRGFMQINQRTNPPQFFNMALDVHQSGLIGIEGKPGKNIKDLSSAERVLEISSQLVKKAKAFPPALKRYFMIFATLRTAEALLQVVKFTDPPKDKMIRMKRVAKLIGLTVPTGTSLADLEKMLLDQAFTRLKQLEAKLATPLPYYTWTKLTMWKQVLEKIKAGKSVTQSERNKLIRELGPTLKTAKEIIKDNLKAGIYAAENIPLVFVALSQTDNLVSYGRNIISNPDAIKTFISLMNLLKQVHPASKFKKTTEILALDKHALNAALYFQYVTFFSHLAGNKRPKPFTSVGQAYIQSAYLASMLSFSTFDRYGRPARIETESGLTENRDLALVGPAPDYESTPQEVYHVWR